MRIQHISIRAIQQNLTNIDSIKHPVLVLRKSDSGPHLEVIDKGAKKWSDKTLSHKKILDISMKILNDSPTQKSHTMRSQLRIYAEKTSPPWLDRVLCKLTFGRYSTANIQAHKELLKMTPEDHFINSISTNPTSATSSDTKGMCTIFVTNSGRINPSGSIDQFHRDHEAVDGPKLTLIDGNTTHNPSSFKEKSEAVTAISGGNSETRHLLENLACQLTLIKTSENAYTSMREAKVSSGLDVTFNRENEEITITVRRDSNNNITGFDVSCSEKLTAITKTKTDTGTVEKELGSISVKGSYSVSIDEHGAFSIKRMKSETSPFVLSEKASSFTSSFLTDGPVNAIAGIQEELENVPTNASGESLQNEFNRMQAKDSVVEQFTRDHMRGGIGVKLCEDDEDSTLLFQYAQLSQEDSRIPDFYAGKLESIKDACEGDISTSVVLQKCLCQQNLSIISENMDQALSAYEEKFRAANEGRFISHEATSRNVNPSSGAIDYFNNIVKRFK